MDVSPFDATSDFSDTTFDISDTEGCLPSDANIARPKINWSWGPCPEQNLNPDQPIIPTADNVPSLVTVIFVTSPVRSHPSTELIMRAIAGLTYFDGVTFNSNKIYNANLIRVIISCDGYQIGKSKRDGRIMGNKVTAEQAQVYEQYKQNLKMDVENIKTSFKNQQRYSVNLNVEIVESTAWLGFGLALKRALVTVKTPYVYVSPHDMELVSPVSLLSILHVLEQSRVSKGNVTFTHAPTKTPIDAQAKAVQQGNVNYVGLPNPNNTTYMNRVNDAKDETMITPVFCYDLFIIPLFMWKENPHIARVKTYREVIYSRRYGVITRGFFIENTVGQNMQNIIKQQGLPAHNEFGTFLLWSGIFADDGSVQGMRMTTEVTKHVDGRKYLDLATQQEKGFRNFNATLNRLEIVKKIMGSFVEGEYDSSKDV